MRIPLRQSALWCVGLPALLALNIHRDLGISKLAYNWVSVQRQNFHTTLSTAGTIEAASILNVKADIDGAVQTTLAQEGQSVHPGQVLIEFSPTEAALEWSRKNDQCRSLEASIHKFRKRLIKRSSREETRQLIETLKSKLKTALADRLIAQRKLRDLRVRASVPGTVLKVTAKNGAVIMMGEPLLVMTDESKFIVRTKVDDASVRKISLGQIVDVTADAFPAETLKGQVKSIGALGAVVIDIVNPKRLAFTHNSTGRVTFHFEDIANAMAVPLRSVDKKENGQAWLMVQTKFGWVRPRRVTLGRTSDEFVQVVRGLEDGESVGVLSMDITDAGADATEAGGDSASMAASSRSKNLSNRDHSSTNKP
jgi:RND family efflux transporter MFP subunit